MSVADHVDVVIGVGASARFGVPRKAWAPRLGYAIVALGSAIGLGLKPFHAQ